jgi:hypothetical protein
MQQWVNLKSKRQIALLKLGGQHDRDVVEIVRGVVPKPHPYKARLGTTPRGIRFAIPLPS